MPTQSPFGENQMLGFYFFSSVGFFKVRKIQKIDKYEMKKMQGEFQISSS